MSASQLCVFDDKTDSKSKWVNKTHSMVVLSGLSSLFYEDFNLWCFFAQFNDDACKVNVSHLNSKN